MASAAGHNESLFFAWDSHSRCRFLVDTGAEVSVLPATGLDTRTGQSGPSLRAANGSSIKTYGACTTKLCFASRQYEWKFIIANVARPLLGADFLRANSLLVDLKGKRLVDAETYLSIPLGKARACAPRLATIFASTDKYDLLLAEFPERHHGTQFFQITCQTWREAFHSHQGTTGACTRLTPTSRQAGIGQGGI